MIEIENVSGVVKKGEIVKQYDRVDGMVGDYFAVKLYSNKGALSKKTAIFVIPEPECLNIFKRETWETAWRINGYVIKDCNSKTANEFKAVMFASDLAEEEIDEFIKEMCEWQLKMDQYLKKQ